ncbi:uncharacterized protein LOC130285389 [Hyla sarda]|uniref:uncharacterized protein LOC130285389 n=1 Tax=Hyla sarda TaxID=327740 RepID=UPI0024C321CC|nr:uncharacterized protein LOC130285389 [Hyla sarda]
MRSFMDDCQHINPSTTDWESDVEDSSLVIFYFSSPPSGRSIEKMEPHLGHSVSVKGHEGVIVVIGDIDPPEDGVRSLWKESKYPQCELHLFTRTEKEWISQDPQQQEMARKIRRVQDILSGGSQEKTIQKYRKNGPGKVFFMRESAQSTGPWLEPLLRTDKVNIIVTDISKMKKLLSKNDDVYCILNLSKETLRKPPQKNNNILRFLEKGKYDVIVVVDDLDDEDSEEELLVQYNRLKNRQAAPLFLFRRKDQQTKYVSSSSEEDKKIQDKWAKLQESIEKRVKSKTPETDDPQTIIPPASTDKKTKPIKDLGTVGIFSRSSTTDYSWMETLLRSDLSPTVSSVRPFYISNNQTVQFFEELQFCKFGILYHTKNRGRVNVTDVTDSLYDEELETMSIMLDYYYNYYHDYYFDDDAYYDSNYYFNY